MSVTVYSDPDYAGKSATLEPGRHRLDPALDNTISSIRVPAGWSVTLYDGADFDGAKATLNADTANLSGVFDNKASSIDVQHNSGNQTNTATVTGAGNTAIQQENVRVTFTNLW